MLPTSPIDGQTIYFQADATNGVVWTLRYRSASASSYKWEYVGGPPLTAGPTGHADPGQGSEATASTTFVDLTTVGPSIVVPLAGDFMIVLACEGYSSASYALMGVSGPTTVASTANAIWTLGINSWGGHEKTVKITAQASGTYTAKYRAWTGTATYSGRRMTILPVRVG